MTPLIVLAGALVAAVGAAPTLPVSSSPILSSQFASHA